MYYYKQIENELNSNFKDRHFDNGILSEHYRRLGMQEIADRLLNCGTYLDFGVSSSGACDPILFSANFCKHRLCPTCSWRRSLKVFSQVSSVVTEIDKDNDIQFLFLTLTVKNCAAPFLSKTIDHLNSSFSQRFLKNNIINGKSPNQIFLGYFKSIEITFNSEYKTFHPHFHILLAVNRSYFTSRDYISHDRLCLHWKRALKVNYDPSVFIEKVKPTISDDGSVSIYKAVAEVAKYTVKSSDILCNSDKDIADLITAFESLHHFRFCSFGGLFKEFFKKLKFDDVNDGDLVNTSNSKKIDLCDLIVRYRWSAGTGYICESVANRENF